MDITTTKRNAGDSKNERSRPIVSPIKPHKKAPKERQRDKTVGKVARHIERLGLCGKLLNVESMIKVLKVNKEVALGVVNELKAEGRLVPKEERGARVYVVLPKTKLGGIQESKKESKKEDKHKNDEIENGTHSDDEGIIIVDEEGIVVIIREDRQKVPRIEQKGTSIITEEVQTRKRKLAKVTEQPHSFASYSKKEETKKGSVKRISVRLQEKRNINVDKDPPLSPTV